MKRSSLILLMMLLSLIAVSQVDDFDAYVREQKSQFSRYKDSVEADFVRYRDSLNREFAKYLANSWEQFKSDEGVERPAEPKPDKMPKIKPGDIAPSSDKIPIDAFIRPDEHITPDIIPEPKPVKPEPIIEPTKPEPVKPEPVKPEPIIEPTKPEPTKPEPVKLEPVKPEPTKPEPAKPEPAKPEPVKPAPAEPSQPSTYIGAKIPFMGLSMPLSVAPQVHDIVLKGVAEKHISDFWNNLTKCDYQNLIKQYRQTKQQQNFNDYAFYQYILKSAATLFPHNPNQQIVYSVFMMNQFGYKAKIGKAGNNLVCLLAISQQVYATSFLTVGNDKFYIFDANTDKKTKSFGAIYTYRDFMQGCSSTIDMNIYNSMLLGKDMRQISIKNDIFGNVQMAVNKNVIDFYKNYPQVEMSVYANADINDDVMRQIVDYLQPQIAGLSEVEAASMLLAFIHKSFPYKTDDEQFGYEKPMFCEETLFYPYSDCEDNAILFVHLVKKLLHLDAVLLDYPGHIATAVCFHDNVSGDYISADGKKYVVCDPTYFGASVGMAMPQFAKVPVKVIALR